MLKSVKIKYNSGSVDIVNTIYDGKFIENINRKGRSKIIDDELLISNKELRIPKLLQAEKKIRKNYKTLQYILKENTFDFFITLSNITKNEYEKFISRLRKADKNLAYLSIAAWSTTSDLHYHISVKTILSLSRLKDKAQYLNIHIKPIHNQEQLIGYFGKNLIKDTISILKQVDNEDFIDKQLEILKYSKILNFSKNLNKPSEIRNPSDDQLKAIKQNAVYSKSLEYSKGNSLIKIDKFKLNLKDCLT